MTQKPQRGVIRKQQLQDVMNPVLAALHDDLGERSARLLTRYHALHVVPLEYRLNWLETPWYRRLFRTAPKPPEVVETVSPEAAREAGGL